MDDRTLQLVLTALKNRHPALLPHLKTLTAQQGTPVAGAATEVLQCLLQVFDEGEQAKWQLRDLLQRVPTLDGGFYWAIKYSATETVYRVVVAGGADLSGVTYFSGKDVPELTNWKTETT